MGTWGATAGEVLTAYLDEHLGQLRAHACSLREGDDASIHRVRIDARRLRSALASYAGVLDPGATRALRDELRWLGGVLAPARDAQVVRERLLDLVAGEPEELVLGPVARRIDGELRPAFRAGGADAAELLASERWRKLLDGLAAFLREPPLAPEASQAAAEVLPGVLRTDLRRVRRRHGAYRAADAAEAQARALHEVRKAAKRLRYSAESAAPVLGKRATTLSKRARRLQQLLGEHQDTVVARRALRDLGVRAHLAGENGFTFGRLHALEEQAAAELVARYPRVYDDLPSPGVLRSWLRA